ncbi:hypothetical protein [Neomegalonema sp.]|uniref:hypothetical protein n=1 Tax=Neomegalonema sp. TaxID=2039713 RepID=UPI0026061007|nr:hypothetical protein [Neomegalonema sp.]MDD2868139.1 hypothetical protein [Neomegalonema sp.]
MRDLTENMRSPVLRSSGLILGCLALAALALGAATGEWLGAAALAAAGALLAANWASLRRWLGLGAAESGEEFLREELEEVRKVSHDAAEDLARMEDILEDLVNESRRVLAENTGAVNQIKNRLLTLDSSESGAHGRLSALEGRLEILDEALAALRQAPAGRAPARSAESFASSSSYAMDPEPSPRFAAPEPEEPARLLRETRDADPAASFLADVASSSARRRRPDPEPAPRAAPQSAPQSTPPGPGDLAESLRHRAREAQQARQDAAARQQQQARPLAPEPAPPPAADADALAALRPLASLAAMAEGGAAPQPQARRTQPPPPEANGQNPNGQNPNGQSPNGQGARAAGPGGPRLLALGQSAPIYALAPRVVAGHELGVAEDASLAERLALAAQKVAELAASGVEEGVHLPLRAAHLTPAAAAEIEALLRANPELGRRLVISAPLGDLAEIAVEPIDALRAHGVALRADVPSPEGLNAETFSRLKVELAAAPSLLALAMAPHAMQMGMALMATEVGDPVMLQALSIAGIPLVSGPATELLAQAGPAPRQA